MFNSRLKKFIRFFFLGLGLTLLVLMIKKYGLVDDDHNGHSDLIETIIKIKWKLFFSLSLPLSWYAMQTWGWYLTIEETGSHIRYLALLKIKLVGEALNTVLPVGFMGGDPVRFSMLKDKMSGSLSAASVVLDRTMQTMAIAVLLVFTLIMASIFLTLPTEWKILLPCFTVGMVLLLWFLIHHQQNGLFEKLLRLVQKLGIKNKKLISLKEHIQALDERLSRFYRENPRRFFHVLLLQVLSRGCGIFEIWITAQFLDIPLGWLGALFLATLTVLINIMFFFIPSSTGVLEGGYGILCHLLGLPVSSGIAIQLMRRARTICWIIIGLILMMISKKSGKSLSSSPQN